MKFRNTIFASILCAVAFSACDNSTGIQPVDLTLTVTFNENYGNIPATGTDVTMTNVTSQETYSGEAGADGTVAFLDLPAGPYDIQAVLTLSKNDVFQLTGIIPDGDEVVFNASISNVTISETTVLDPITLSAGRIGDLVFKQIYYAGSDRVVGALFRDQFLELYNNSDTRLYLDGLYIMGVYGNASTTRTEYVTATGQFDWNQSIGMPTDIDANNDYLHAKWIYQFPGSGEQYPVEPGESVIVAQTAINHKAPYVSNTGDTISVGDPSLTVDLSNADFEVYVGDEFDRPLASDIDNPSVPNMLNVFIFGRDFILDNVGRDAFVIFRAPAGVTAADFEAYPSPISREIRDNTTFYPQIPNEWVIDAVETQPSPSNQIPRKLVDQLDAGYTFVADGAYSSNSVIRLEAQRFGSRIVIKNTNNSTEDFTFLQRAEPGAASPQSPTAVSRMTPDFASDDTAWLDALGSKWSKSVRRNR